MGNCCGKKSAKAHQNHLPHRQKEFLTFIESFDTMQNHYTIIKKIGEGATSHVKLVQCKYTKVERAIKTLSISTERNLKRAQEEVKILKTIDHPTLLRSVESFQDKASIHIVAEYYSGPTLYDRLEAMQKFSEQETLTLMYYILSGINYLHKHQIMHRDIKPENLMFESSDPASVLKIIDFGSAKIRRKIVHKKKTGTVLYMSPEVLNGKYTEKCDIWSAGIIFCIMLTGVHPFYCDNEQDMMEKIRKLPLQFKGQRWEGISETTKGIISKMLEKQESNRASAENLLKNACFNMKFVLQRKDIEKISEMVLGFAINNEIQKSLINVGIIRVLESKNFSKLFLYLDQDSDGKINLKDYLGHQSSVMTFTEFLIKNTRWNEILNIEVLKGIFSQLDEDNDDMITMQDFLRYYSLQDTTASVNSHAATSENQKISFEEFSSSLKTN